MFPYLDLMHRRLYKTAFYAKHAPMAWLPHAIFPQSPQAAHDALARLPTEQQAYIHQRVDYYNQLNQSFALSPQHSERAGIFRKAGKISSYYYDLKALLRYFPAQQCFEYEFGDVTHVPERPKFVKSRPIGDDNAHSVLLKLDSVRHFYLRQDPYRFENKRDLLVWRGIATQPHRLRFLQQYHQHPQCDVGCVYHGSVGQPYHVDYLTIPEQLRYRYILSMEGNDVATNLKWILASQSLCVMTTPKYETWLMEGRLQADVHYIHVQDDYADLFEKIDFYRAHPQAAQTIIANANAWMKPFFNQQIEWITQILVMQKYFDLAENSFQAA